VSTPTVDAWSAVAPGYLDYWVPRFRPFLEDAVAALGARDLPTGPTAIPGCGPGEEVLLVRSRYPERDVVALDPSGPMLELLRSRVAGDPRARLVQADAEAVPAHATGAAAVLSCFTLQLLERPLDALAAWSRALAPGGALVVLFWPRQDPAAPWGRLRPEIEAETGPWREEWEPEVRARLASVGLVLQEDRDVTHPMRHASPEEAWDRLVDSGSLQGLARRVAPDALARCRARWLADHRLVRDGDAFTHTPSARLWVLARDSG
jgi:SAM-dependent methyltransferase